jgi:hypothetical protein
VYSLFARRPKTSPPRTDDVEVILVHFDVLFSHLIPNTVALKALSLIDKTGISKSLNDAPRSTQLQQQRQQQRSIVDDKPTLPLPKV